MNTLEFLQRVLPTTGFFCTTVINGPNPEDRKQGFFASVDDLAKAVQGLSNRGDNTYFAISTFSEKGSRKQDNVHATKVVALDVDCGPKKPYADWRDGVRALSEFIRNAVLPRPLIVRSGNGLHVYWILDTELPPEKWKPLAEGLKAAVAQHGFKVDAGLTANSSLVLRPVGTINPKNGATVTLLSDAGTCSYTELAEALSVYQIPTSTLGSTRPISKLAQALAVTSDMPAAVGMVVATKCQQIAWGVRNQADVPEPMWYGMMGVAAYCTEPEAVAIAWSEGHPDFNPARAISKMKHWQASTTGPATCAKFETDRPGGCKGCKYKDKIGTPARLGVQYQEVAAPTEAPDSTAVNVPLPKPFKRTASGMKMTMDESDVDICPFDIYPVSYGRDESLGYETVRFHWKRPHVGWQELVMRQAYLADGSREFPTVIADQGIVLNGKRQTELFQLMLRSYMDELRRVRSMTNLYANMGWKENFTQFVIGDTIYRRETDGSISEESISLAAGSSKLGHELYSVLGSQEAWTEFTTVMDKAQLYPHMFAMCIGLSAPLYEFTGLKGLTISLYGPTGGGKTLAQLWMQSAWGLPDKLHFAAKFTQNALFNRMGMYCHMPVTIDEVTMMADKDVGDFLYWVSQGRDKARLNRNSEERDAKNFALPVVVSTNRSMHAKMLASGLDTDAQMARLLEVSVKPNVVFTRGSAAGKMIYDFIHLNNGHVGRALVKKLLELGPEGIQAAIADHMATFKQKYRAKFSGEERYWEQAIVLADLIGKLATEWGLIKFDYTKGIEWVLEQIGAIRRAVSDNQLDAFDLLSEYLNDNADAALSVIHTGSQKPTVDHSRIPRNDLRLRFDLYRKSAADPFSNGTILIDRTHFRKWLSLRGGDYKSFNDHMAIENILATPKSQKAYLGKDSPIKLGQSYVIGINLNHPRLFGILDRADQDVENLAYGQLKLV
jgi:Domain of unknown function (DUF927)